MRRPGLWRYHEMLPPVPEDARIMLGEGTTPLLDASHLAAELDVRRVWIKDESPNPTGSFKARGLAMAVSVAHTAGANRFAVPSAGNAGLALAAYCARAGATAHVVLPEDVPAPFVRACRLLGADVRLVPGVISDAAAVVAALRDTGGVRDVSTLREPFRLEGKKTMGYEIAEAFPERLPDVIVYPTGGGTGIIGIWKAFQELRAAGWFGDTTLPALPRMVCVQAEGCAPLVRAWHAHAGAIEPWQDARTLAAGLRVPRPVADREILDVLRESGGTAIAVCDTDLLHAARFASETTGVFMCPEGGATVAAVRALRKQGWLQQTDEILLLNTGSGALYLDVLDPPQRSEVDAGPARREPAGRELPPSGRPIKSAGTAPACVRRRQGEQFVDRTATRSARLFSIGWCI
jgi:threonine synthase